MARKQDKAQPGKDERDERLKAALKANLARRKAQAKARDSRKEEEQNG
jgi:hypothetical protein